MMRKIGRLLQLPWRIHSAGATVTIAATSSNNSDDGCFSQANPDKASYSLREPGVFVREHILPFPQSAFGGDDPGHWPLLRRAWVYQERKMSARVIHMGKEQLYWEYNACFLSEDGFEDLVASTPHYDLKHRSTNDPISSWRTIVQHYSSLQLTFEEVRLPAISALVRQLQPLRNDDVYIASMWRNSILTELPYYVRKNKLLTPSEQTRHLLRGSGSLYHRVSYGMTPIYCRLYDW